MLTGRSFDVVVVGGGLVGCSIARELAGEGRRVAVIEAATLGSGASHAAAGMLAPQAEIEEGGAFLALCIESRDLFPGLANELHAEVGAEIRYRDDGSLHVAFGEEEAERLRHIAAVQARLGLEAELVLPEDARRLEPALSHDVTLAMSIPGDHQVDNRRLTAAVIASCRARGVELVERTPVDALALDEVGYVCGVRANGGTVYADTVIVAAGCWASRVAGFEIPVEPVKGEVLALDFSAPPFARVLRSERCYLVSRIDGRVIVGATQKRVGFDLSVASEAVAHLLESAREIVPSLSSATSGEAWAGLRPATPDGLPAVGLVDENLIAAVGHYRNGILLAPMTAKLVADIVAGRPAHPALELLDPRRFLAPRSQATS